MHVSRVSVTYVFELIFIANFEIVTCMHVQVVLGVPFPPTECLGTRLVIRALEPMTIHFLLPTELRRQLS